MKLLRDVVALSVVSLFSASGTAFAQDYHHDDHHHDSHYDEHGGPSDHYVHHNDWHHGGHISHNDWNRGREVDYRHYHLSAPPRGYAWREVDGNYVLAAVTTGVIASVIAASAAR